MYFGHVSQLDEFSLNSQARAHSGSVPKTFRNLSRANHGTNEDRSQNDPHPEVGVSLSQSPQYLGTKEIFNMVTGVQEEIHFCSSGTSPGKQKNARSTSQPQCRSENTLAPIDADQISSAIQQLASISNSANLNNNISLISILSQSFTTTMRTFDGKPEKFELFEDLFQTSSKLQNQLTEYDKIE